MPNDKIKATPIDNFGYQALPDEDYTLNKGETSDFTSRELNPQMIPGVSIPQADAALLLGSLGNFQIGRDFLTLGSGTSTAGLSGTITTGNDVRIFAGATHPNRATAPFRVHEDGSLVATSATISGSITATSGAIGGWTITATAITSGSVTLNSANEQILLGAATAPLTGIGIFIGKDGADYEIRAGNPAGSYMHWTGSAVNINGPVLTALASGSEIAIQDWSYSGAFSVTDLNTIAWAGGTLALMNGATYTITGSNTGNMAAFTYIYLDISVSTTLFQVATSFTSGSGKILIATAQNGTAEASYLMMGGSGTYNIAGGNIAASSIIASKLSVSQLSAITADMGTITAGTITGATIQTASSGTRFVMNSTSFQGINASGTVIFEIIISGTDAGDAIIGDDATSQYAKWDNSASTFKVNGFALARQEIFGTGTDGNVTISVNTTLSADMYYNNLTITSGAELVTNAWRIFVLGTLTINSGCFINWDGITGSTGGNSQAGGGPGGGGGTALTGNSLPGSATGGAGGNGGQLTTNGYSGNAVSAVTKALGGAGGGGGIGGAAQATYTGGAGASGVSSSGTIYNTPTSSSTAAYLLMDSRPTPTAFAGGISGGGGGGGAGYTAQAGAGGGGGGSAGGTIAIYAKTIVNNGTINARGGNGGNGGINNTGSGTGGGGGGGGGGVIILVYNALSGSGTTSVAGGSAGTPGSCNNAPDAAELGNCTVGGGFRGASGIAGSAGTVYQLQIT